MAALKLQVLEFGLCSLGSLGAMEGSGAWRRAWRDITQWATGFSVIHKLCLGLLFP